METKLEPGLSVLFHFTDRGERKSRPGVIETVWSEAAVNITVTFEDGDLHYGKPTDGLVGLATSVGPGTAADEGQTFSIAPPTTDAAA